MVGIGTVSKFAKKKQMPKLPVERGGERRKIYKGEGENYAG